MGKSDGKNKLLEMCGPCESLPTNLGIIIIDALTLFPGLTTVADFQVKTRTAELLERNSTLQPLQNKKRKTTTNTTGSTSKSTADQIPHHAVKTWGDLAYAFKKYLESAFNNTGANVVVCIWDKPFVTLAKSFEQNNRRKGQTSSSVKTLGVVVMGEMLEKHANLTQRTSNIGEASAEAIVTCFANASEKHHPKDEGEETTLKIPTPTIAKKRPFNHISEEWNKCNGEEKKQSQQVFENILNADVARTSSDARSTSVPSNCDENPLMETLKNYQKIIASAQRDEELHKSLQLTTIDDAIWQKISKHGIQDLKAFKTEELDRVQNVTKAWITEITRNLVGLYGSSATLAFLDRTIVMDWNKAIPVEWKLLYRNERTKLIQFLVRCLCGVEPSDPDGLGKITLPQGKALILDGHCLNDPTALTNVLKAHRSACSVDWIEGRLRWDLRMKGQNTTLSPDGWHMPPELEENDQALDCLSVPLLLEQRGDQLQVSLFKRGINRLGEADHAAPWYFQLFENHCKQGVFLMTHDTDWFHHALLYLEMYLASEMERHKKIPDGDLLELLVSTVQLPQIFFHGASPSLHYTFSNDFRYKTRMHVNLIAKWIQSVLLPGVDWPVGTVVATLMTMGSDYYTVFFKNVPIKHWLNALARYGKDLFKTSGLVGSMVKYDFPSSEETTKQCVDITIPARRLPHEYWPLHMSMNFVPFEILTWTAHYLAHMSRGKPKDESMYFTSRELIVNHSEALRKKLREEKFFPPIPTTNFMIKKFKQTCLVLFYASQLGKNVIEDLDMTMFYDEEDCINGEPPGFLIPRQKTSATSKGPSTKPGKST